MKYQVAVIGGGPAGYTAAETAGKAGLSVVLFEKQNLGGVCLNEGCIPTKTLLYSAKVFDYAKHSSKYGVTVNEPSYDLPKIIARKQKVVRKLVLGVKSKMKDSNVTVVNGQAYINDNYHVTCNNETYECENIIICTGSDTFVPHIEGIDSVAYWTHKNALENKDVPQSLAIVGGGVIGMEFASFFNSLGVKVTVIEMMNEILGGIDKEIASLLRAEYTKRGVDFKLSSQVLSVTNAEKDGAGCIEIKYKKDGVEENIMAERLLMSVGRRPVVNGFGLENLKLETGERGRIITDKQMRTSVENVFVCGDLTGFSTLAHTAVREAEVAINTILGKADSMSYKAIPGVVYTNPEVAGVGQTEDSLTNAGEKYKTVKLPMGFSGRFVAENEGVNGVCKLLLSPDNKILGAHLIGNPSSEIITLAGMAIELGMTTEEWKRIVFPHPTVGEIFREAL